MLDLSGEFGQKQADAQGQQGIVRTDKLILCSLNVHHTGSKLNIVSGLTFDRFTLGKAVSHLVWGNIGSITSLVMWHTKWHANWISTAMDLLDYMDCKSQNCKPADWIKAFCILAKAHLRWWHHLSFLDSGRKSCLSHHYCASVTYPQRHQGCFSWVECFPPNATSHLYWLTHLQRHTPLQKP